jgi:hypothetical protein
VIVPHAGWRGVYEVGTFIAANCTSVYLPSYEVVQQDSTGHRMSSPVVDANGNEYDGCSSAASRSTSPARSRG